MAEATGGQVARSLSGQQTYWPDCHASRRPRGQIVGRPERAQRADAGARRARASSASSFAFEAAAEMRGAGRKGRRGYAHLVEQQSAAE